jgi:hypothetical protein
LNFILSDHANAELEQRSIPPHLVTAVLSKPEQIVPERNQRKAYQSRVDLGGKIFLLRAIVRDDLVPPVVVTVYRTSRIAKYWRPTP